MVYKLSVFFSSKFSLFHNSNLFVYCVVHVLYTECAKILKNNSGAERLMELYICRLCFGVAVRT